MGNIMETLITDGRFNTLVSAIQAANLSDTLTKPGPYTLFAATDDAFAGMPAGEVDRLMADIPALTRLVSYHVVPGRLMAADVLYADSLTTVQGDPLKIQRYDSKPYVNDAQIIGTDVLADNGVIHIIDAVLLPPMQ